MISHIYNYLKQENKLALTGMLILSSLFTVVLVTYRIRYSGVVTYAFLIWNLFLAWIPFGLAICAAIWHEKKLSKLFLFGLLALWLLFFPNAMYILTDFFHLKHRSGVPLWFDLILITSAAWNGIMLGFLSLSEVQKIVTKLTSNWLGWSSAIVALMLASFGIYLGRFERWNSWDIVTQPTDLMGRVLSPIVDPFSNKGTIALTICLGAFLILSYTTVKLIGNSRHSSQSIH